MTSANLITTNSQLTLANHWDHFKARWGINRSGHRVAPGLYALGTPNADSPVLVTANYSLSFDALRKELPGQNVYILVLDTRGVNVWCAAGKGTFGTDEIVKRVQEADLRSVVNKRVLILPQLGAPGVAAHEVKKQTGFKVEYGPVRAADLPAYLMTRTATPEMRRVTFPLGDRITLVPMELIHTFLPMLGVAIALYLLGGPLAALAVITAVLTGVVLFPILLPWLPYRDFSLKGFILGGLAALPFAAASISAFPGSPVWLRAGLALAFLLAMPPVTAFLALNFTGSSTYTSKTGVEREMKTYIRVMAATFGLGIIATIGLNIYRLVS